MYSPILIVPIQNFLGEFDFLNPDGQFGIHSFENPIEQALKQYKNNGWKIIAIDYSLRTLESAEEQSLIQDELSFMLSFVDPLDSIQLAFPQNQISLGTSKEPISNIKKKTFYEFWEKEITLDVDRADYLLGWSVMRTCYQFLDQEDSNWKDALLLLSDDLDWIEFCQFHDFYYLSSSLFANYIEGNLSEIEFNNLDADKKLFLRDYYNPRFF